MYATDLIGKIAIRTKPVMEAHIIHSGFVFGGGDSVRDVPSYYHCTTPILILNATEHHIVYERYPKPSNDRPEPYILDVRYCDGNWIDYEKLMKGPAKTDEEFGFEVVNHDDPEVAGPFDFPDAGPGIDFKSKLKGPIEVGVDFGREEISPIAGEVYRNITRTTEVLKEAHPEAYESLGDVPDEYWKETPDPDCQSLPKDFLQPKEEE